MKIQTASIALAIIFALMLAGCDADQVYKPDPTDGGLLVIAVPEDFGVCGMTEGGDPDGVGVEILRVVDADGQDIAPGSTLPDEAIVFVVYVGQRIEPSTWGAIKKEWET